MCEQNMVLLEKSFVRQAPHLQCCCVLGCVCFQMCHTLCQQWSVSQQLPSGSNLFFFHSSFCKHLQQKKKQSEDVLNFSFTKQGVFFKPLN